MNYTATPLVDGNAPRDAYPLAHSVLCTAGFNPVPDTNNTGGDADVDVVGAISINNVLPDDVTERILSLLPVATMLRASSVCRRWHHIVRSTRFLCAAAKPWYFMFTSNEDASGYAYDPILRKWYRGLDLPCIEKSSWLTSSSCGLVCFMDNDTRSLVFICNPITRDRKRIPTPPGARVPDYSTLAMAVDRESHRYTVAVTKTKQHAPPDDFLRWDFSIHIYESQSGSWITAVNEVMLGWHGGDDSVVCDGVFYCLIHRTNIYYWNSDHRHALIAYDLSAAGSPPHASLIRTLIPAPCFLSCARLMNVSDRLVMVGGIARYDRPDVVKGISIWELHGGEEWREVAKMPHRFFQGFGELDDVFASSGSDGLIFIQSFGATALLVFDMNQKQWKWSAKCPVTKRFPLQLFSGFCFEPRLQVAS